MQKTVRYVGVVALVVVFFVLGVYYEKSVSPKPSENLVTTETTASILVDLGDGTISTLPVVSVTSETTLASALVTLSEKGSIKLKSKDYGQDLGLFVEAINDIPATSDNERYWQFWVNNVYSTKGVSQTMLKPGDIVMFKFTKGQQ